MVTPLILLGALVLVILVGVASLNRFRTRARPLPPPPPPVERWPMSEAEVERKQGTEQARREDEPRWPSEFTRVISRDKPGEAAEPPLQKPAAALPTPPPATAAPAPSAPVPAPSAPAAPAPTAPLAAPAPSAPVPTFAAPGKWSGLKSHKKPPKHAAKKKAAPPVRDAEEFGVSESGVDDGIGDEQAAIQEPSQVEVPSDVPIDNVHFTLTGPLVLAPDTAHELQFWLHVEQQRLAVLQAASALQGLPPSQLSVKTEGPYPLQRGSRVSVRLTIDGLKCLDSHKWITWTGEIGSTTFVVEVPLGTSEGAYQGRASIRLNGGEIARMSFLVRVGAANLKVDEIPSQTTSYRSAFASYASEDRAEVLSRVQGMEAAGMDVFVDVVNLRSGQNWERELTERISKADVFYLFWCCHAMKSEWVAKEWHLAMKVKGPDFIDPVPLQRPELAPPPNELAAKHFNDPLLAFIAAAGGAHSD